MARVRRITVQDIAVNYVDTGYGPTVVCLHGWGSSLVMWQSTSAYLRRTYRVLALDLPGFGDSACPSGGFDFTPRTYAHFIADFVAQAVPHTAPVTVVGHSMGGMIATQLALDHPAVVGGLVLADPVLTGNVGPGMSRLLRTRLGQRMLARSGRSNWLQPLGAQVVARDLRLANDPGLQRSVRDMARAAPDALVNSLRAIITTDLSPRLPEIGVPTLVIVGAHDVTVSVGEARLAAQRFPHAHLAVIPRAQHRPMDQQPELFDRLVASYLHRYVPPRVTHEAGRGEPYSPVATGLPMSRHA